MTGEGTATHLPTPLERPFQLEDWWVDPMANELRRGDRTTRVEPKAMLLLAYLAGRAERPVTREALTATIWPDVVVGEDSLSRLVFQLRRALGEDSRHPRFIETLPKVGYRLAVAIDTSLPTKGSRTPQQSDPIPVIEDSFRKPLPSISLLLMALLGGTFSCGWWSGRRVARQRFGATDRALENRSR